jgi:hypothetical protein
MHALFEHSAVGRGVSVFARMLLGKVISDVAPDRAIAQASDLVSWCSGGRSRREDELARSSQLHSQ